MRRDWDCIFRAHSCGRSAATCGTTRRSRAVRSCWNWRPRDLTRAIMEMQKSSKAIRLLLLDDHVLFRESLSRLLASEADFEMAGHVGAPAEALDVLRRTAVDVVLLDFDLGDDHGSRFIGDARKAGYEGKILMVT